METITIYDNVCHLGDNKIVVIPQGLTKQQFVARLKSESLIPSGKFTASGREYCNFAPMVVEGDVKFTTLDSIKAIPL